MKIAGVAIRGGRGADADPLFPGGGLLRRRLGRRRSAVHVRAVVVRYLFRRLQRFDRSLRAGYADEMDVPFRNALLVAFRGGGFRFDSLAGVRVAEFRRGGFYRARGDVSDLSAVACRTEEPAPDGVGLHVQLPAAAGCLAGRRLAGMDRFTTIKAAAVVLVFAGVYAVTRSKSKAQMDAEASRR